MIPLSTAKSSARSDRRAFSLLEMMVALFVASVLMIILVKFVQTATSAIVSGEDRLYATNDAQAAMDLLETDLLSVRAIQIPSSAVGTPQGNAVEVLQGFGNGNISNSGVLLTPQGSTHPATSSIYPMDLYLLATPPASYTTGGTTLTGGGLPHLCSI